MNSILIQGGRVIDPSQKFDSEADILIEDGKIVAVAKPGQIPTSKAKEIISAKGKWVIPGLIDSHVHLREPGLEYKETIETGSHAAVAGGFTSIACMANTHPVNDNPYVTSYIREKAHKTAVCRVFPIGAVSKGLKGEELAEIGLMIKEGVVAVSDDGHTVMNSYLMRKAMDYTKAFGVAVISHAEDENLVGHSVMNESAFSNSLGLRGNPAAAEEIIVARDIALCRLTRCKLHLAHISTAIAVDHIRRAKEAGLPVTAEVSPHHLVLTEEAVKGYDTNYKMAPPLRSAEDVETLQKALAAGIIDIIATDHAPHGLIEKALEYDQAANGIIGLQTAVPVTFKLVQSGVFTPSQWVASMTYKAAQILGIPYGTLAVGRDADLTILDPAQKWTFSSGDILSKSHNTPFLGWDFTGKITQTLVKGSVVYNDSKETPRT